MLPWHEMLTLNPAGWCSDIPQTIGPYTLAERLNDDATVQVYHAFHEGYARGVRLEIVDTGKTNESIDSIARKAASWLRTRHRHLYTPIDVGEHAGYVYLAFERIPGGTLAAGLSRARKRGHIIPSSQILHVGTSLGQALLHLHSSGFVHGCVSPGAVVVSLEGTWLLTDLEPGLLHLPVPMPYDKQNHYLPQDNASPSCTNDAYAFAVMLAEMLLNLPPRIAVRTISDQLYATTPGLHDVPERLFNVVRDTLRPEIRSESASVAGLLDTLQQTLYDTTHR